MNIHHAWVNQGNNFLSEENARKWAQMVANAENRVVQVQYDQHGGYPAHYNVMAKNERLRTFAVSCFFVTPEKKSSPMPVIQDCLACGGKGCPDCHLDGCLRNSLTIATWYPQCGETDRHTPEKKSSPMPVIQDCLACGGKGCPDCHLDGTWCPQCGETDRHAEDCPTVIDENDG